MDRIRFRSIWSGVSWAILILSWFNEFTIFGIDPFFIVIGMWLLGGTITKMIYGSEPKSKPITQSPSSQSNPPIIDLYPERDELLCPSCGYVGRDDHVFCEECGTTLERTSTQYSAYK